MTLSDVPDGFDISNGLYHGWCVEQTIRMTQHVNHTVILYSSVGQSLPVEYRTIPWDYINYVLNHQQGNQSSIQQAIWYFTDDIECSTDPDAYAMIIASEQYGGGFIPAPGDQIAVPVIGVPYIQLSFLETTIPLPQSIEGLVWKDTNRNGVQDNGEPGIQHIIVQLSQKDNLYLKATNTTASGRYYFTNVTTGSYYLTFVLPNGYRFSPQDQGEDDAKDSDVDDTGRTPVFLITLNQTQRRWDVGMYPLESHITRTPNHRPTADGTAGEPYNGFIHQPLLFNGSRSYDRDGSIISWLWSFGDGTTGSGETIFHSYNFTSDYPVLLTVTDNQFASDTYTTTAHITQGNNPPTTPSIIGPVFGHVQALSEYLLVATDPDNDALHYIITWGDNYSTISPFVDSGHPLSLSHHWDARGFYTLRCYAQDQHNASSPVTDLRIAIDVQYVGPYGYLIDVDSNGIFDTFYSNQTHTETKVKHVDDDNYAIDIDGDGDFDIIFNTITNQYNQYTETSVLEYFFLILLVIAVLLISYFIRVKRQTRTLHKPRK